MLSMYDRIAFACKEHGCTPGFMCDELGLYRSFLTELKTGRTRVLSTEKVALIAQYLGCSCDWIILGEEHKSDLSDEERNVIHALRTCPLNDRQNVLFMLRNYMPVPADKAEESAV